MKAIKKASNNVVTKLSQAGSWFASKSRKFQTGVFVAAFAVVGASVILISQAASPPATEPESWSISANSNPNNGCINIRQDLTASNSSAIEFLCPAGNDDGGNGGDDGGHDDHGNTGQNCTPGTQDIMGPCIDKARMPASNPGFSWRRFDSSWATGGEPGAFRSRCDYSHMNFDDPILYPNRPNAAHLHTFFGNTLTNASSTPSSLRNSGNSTCAGGIFNRSAYWIPSMVDSTNGRPIAPNDDRNQYVSDLEIYYKLGYQGVGYRDVRPFPAGLQIIAGNPANQKTKPGSNARVKYGCEGPGYADRDDITGAEFGNTEIPICSAPNILVMNIDFPQCWDGVNLTSPDGRAHMAYGTWHPGYPETSVGCPRSHPVGLPHIEMKVRWRIQSGDTRNWRLSSDSYTGGRGGWSGHADYIFAWEAGDSNGAFESVVNNCYRTLRDCQYNLGDGRDPHFERQPRR